jgi:hypothetical protein
MEGMVSIQQQLQRRTRPELHNEWLENLQVRKPIAAPLQEEHRQAYLKQMRTTLLRRPSSGMKGEPKEGQTPDSR